jgi:membrane protein
MIKFKIFRILGNYISLSFLKKIIHFINHYFIGVFRRFNHHLFLEAAGLAYSLLLSIIPMTLILFALLGNWIDTPTIEEQVNRLIDTILPYPRSAEYVKQFIITKIPEVIQYKTLVAYLGGFGLFFTSSWLFSSMRTVLNKIFGVSEQKSEFIGILRDFGMVILFVIFILLSTFILPSLNFIVQAADQIDFLASFQLSGFMDFLLSAVSVIIIFLLFYTFYFLIPYEKLGKLVPAVAALWATILWEVARSLFGYYVFNFLTVNKVYGAFILTVVILFWIFYSAILFILGAEIGQLFRERRIMKLEAKLKNA